MNVVGKVGNLISQGVYSVATPFHPFGGAVDVIVVEQEDGTYRSTPWHVRFGKFQGVLKGAEKVVGISVNDVEADFHMFLDNSGEAYFVREVDSGICTKTEPELGNNNVCSDSKISESSLADNVDGEKDIFHGNDGDGKAKNDEQTYGFQDNHSTSEISVGSTNFTPYHYGSLDEVEDIVESSNNSKAEMVLVSVDGHVLTAPISSSDTENVQLDTPQFHLGPGDDSADEFASTEKGWVGDIIDEFNTSSPKTSEVHGSSSRVPDNSGVNSHHDPEFLDTPSIVKTSDDVEELSPSLERNDTFMSCVDLPELSIDKDESDSQNLESPNDIHIKPKRLENSHFANTKSNVSEVKADDGFSDDIDEVNKLASTCGELHDTNIKVEVYERENVIEMRSGRVNCDEFNVDSEFHRLQCIEIDRKSKEKKNIIIGDNYSITIANHSPKLNEEEESEVKESSTAVMLTEDGKKNSESQNQDTDSSLGFEVSLCGNILHAGIGKSSAAKAFESLRVSKEEFEANGPAIIKNKNLIVRYNEMYFFWDKAAPIVLGMAVYGVDLSVDPKDAIPVEQEVPKALDDAAAASPSPRRWRLFSIPFRRAKSLQPSNSSNEEELENPESILHNPETEPSAQDIVNDEKLPSKQFKRTNVPTNEQIASLRLKDGQNMITFSFCTRVLGKQEVNAHIYLWKWNARIVISDVDGTITKSDVLGQFMPLVGKDWSQLGVARLFCSIKENGYQLLFLSARAIVQAYLTRSFLLNLKQDGKTLPNGPVVISPDGLFPSLYREVIRRAPHEFKIACLKDIKALFPSDHNPFYAGFGNRDTDELSYRKIGIPRGKIFIINPKGEVAINHCIDVKSYTSLHTLINDMFPPTSIAEEEDYNSWNYWKMPLPSIED